MGRAEAKAWQRFNDQVLSRPDWPRGLRFAAIEDALRAALGVESRLLAEYRADLAELLRLERAESGSYHDEERIAQLEAQIGRLIELADATIMQADGPGEDASASAVEAAAAALNSPPFRPAPARSVILAVVLLLAGAAGAAAYYELRMTANADQQIVRLTRLLDHRVAELRGDLDQRLDMADRLHERMSYLHAELSADIDEFGATMTESVRSITTLSANLIAELELSAEGGGVSQSIRRLRARTVGLGQSLDQVGLELSSLKSRMPELRDEVLRMSTGVQRMGTDLKQVDVELDALKARGPELTAWLAGQKDELEQALQNGRGALSEIGAKVGEFESEVGQSRELLQELNRTLDQGLQRAKLDGEALETATQDVRDAEQRVAELMAGVEAKVEAAQLGMRQKIEQLLSGLAAKADLAVLRGHDMIGRAQSEIDRKVEAASEKAFDDLAKTRETQLALLAARISATQRDLEQTRAALVVSWQRMDQNMAERQSRVLAGLDAYASAIEARVEEFLNALDVMVVRTDG
jgi:chromosome segregation ATPase